MAGDLRVRSRLGGYSDKLGLGMRDVTKARPGKPKPGRWMHLSVDRKWRTIGSESPA